MPRASLMYFTTFSVLPVSEVSSAAMNSTGIMRFQIGGLIGEERVGAGVRFVEAVAREFGHQVEDAFGFFRGDFSRGATGQEFLALRGHFLAFLLAHGAAQNVGFTEGKSGEAIGDLHHLFLIQDDAVGFFERFPRAAGKS